MKAMFVQRRGFTLVEILITIALMGILTAIGLTSYSFSIQKSRDSVRKSDLALISKAVTAWAGDFGEFPDDDGNGKMLACDAGNTFKVTGNFSACDWGKSLIAFTNDGQQLYLSKIPADPLPADHYYYKRTSSGFSLFSILENTQDASYVSDAGAADFGAGVITCSGSRTCNYQMTEGGVK